MAKYRFNVRDYQAYFGIKLRDQDKFWAPNKVQTLYKNAALLDPRKSQFDAVWGSYGIA